MFPDGRSFITSVASRQSVVWMHDGSGDRQVSVEGYSFDPKLTPDGKQVCYRILKGALTTYDPGELHLVELDTGHHEPLLAGLAISGQVGLAYDISRDGRQVVAAANDRDGKPRLWLRALDRQSPARQIPNVEGDAPLWGRGAEIVLSQDRRGCCLRLCGSRGRNRTAEAQRPTDRVAVGRLARRSVVASEREAFRWTAWDYRVAGSRRITRFDHFDFGNLSPGVVAGWRVAVHFSAKRCDGLARHRPNLCNPLTSGPDVPANPGGRIPVRRGARQTTGCPGHRRLRCHARTDARRVRIL